MAHVKFTGHANERVLTAADFRTLGVEDVTKTVFPRGIAVEVPEALATVLTKDARTAASFELVSEKTPVPVEPAPVEKLATKEKVDKPS